MNCPTCQAEMKNGKDFTGEWAHVCNECGTLVCVDCGFVMKSLEDSDNVETHTGTDYFCPECERGVYSIDLYPE